MNYQIADHRFPTLASSLLPLLKERTPDFHQLNFKWRNQRQLRKQRRQAAAAGKKGVFSKRLRGTTR